MRWAPRPAVPTGARPKLNGQNIPNFNHLKSISNFPKKGVVKTVAKVSSRFNMVIRGRATPAGLPGPDHLLFGQVIYL
jgi:hypothetical protein